MESLAVCMRKRARKRINEPEKETETKSELRNLIFHNQLHVRDIG